ncbi:cystine transport system substrate-binding protein [Deinococcus metalli]|uniref:Cysteine ABC transporter substrate-binding protein n=1 Tax=Deinococcus metalli TaxID=1141878 RepID=A0A7W8KG81_9DEIO|nr:transporter substrate-binding domain-containing protein [Deinococcus metalli]MBB5377634.1 cystine transport system substrate-binding protein [Deinococcus metalli]GHF52201.1 cysteine ABC transporter substrate-binding protein [Deinococcus metalli]
MKHLILLSTAALAASASAATAPTTLTKGVLKIGMEGTYAPFTYKDDKGQLTGFDVDIAKAVAAKLGLKAEFVLTEWSGILAGLQANKYDVIVNQVGITAERQKTIGFSAPYAYSSPQIIVKKAGTFSPKTLADLSGKRVGVGLGSNFEKQLRDAGGINVVTYPGAPEYLADLAAGRLDAAYNDRLLVGYLIKSQNLPVRGAGVIGSPEAVGIAMKKSNTALKVAVDKALLQLKADGTYAKISRQWFGQDVSKP